jgi:hypothetical protein
MLVKQVFCIFVTYRRAAHLENSRFAGSDIGPTQAAINIGSDPEFCRHLNIVFEKENHWLVILGIRYQMIVPAAFVACDSADYYPVVISSDGVGGLPE